MEGEGEARELAALGPRVEKELREMRKQLIDRPIPAVAAPVPPVTTSATVVASGTSREERETRQYWRARRSARFFPVHGENEKELRVSLSAFFEHKLKIPAGDCPQEEVELVRRVRMRRDKQCIGEVTVLFTDIETGVGRCHFVRQKPGSFR